MWGERAWSMETRPFLIGPSLVEHGQAVQFAQRFSEDSFELGVNGVLERP